jgi:hypothetical protein
MVIDRKGVKKKAAIISGKDSDKWFEVIKIQN